MELIEYCKENNIKTYIYKIYYEPEFLIDYNGAQFRCNSDICSFYNFPDDKLQLLYRDIPNFYFILSFCEKYAKVQRGETDILDVQLAVYASFTDVQKYYEYDKCCCTMHPFRMSYRLTTFQQNSEFSKALGITQEELFRDYAKGLSLDEIVKKHKLQQVMRPGRLEFILDLQKTMPVEEIGRLFLEGWSLRDIRARRRYAIEASKMGIRPDFAWKEIPLDVWMVMPMDELYKSLVHGIHIDLCALETTKPYARVTVQLSGILSMSKEDKRAIIKRATPRIYKAALRSLALTKEFLDTGKSAESIKCDQAIHTKQDDLVFTFSW